MSFFQHFTADTVSQIKRKSKDFPCNDKDASEDRADNKPTLNVKLDWVFVADLQPADVCLRV